MSAYVSRNTNTGASVSHPGAEVVDGACLVEASQSPLVVLASAWVVLLNVLHMFGRHLLDGLLDMSETQRLP